MSFRSLCVNRRASQRIGLAVVALGAVHQVLSPWWIRYLHLTGQRRTLSIDFASGLAMGVGIAYLLDSFRNNRPEPAPCLLMDSEAEQPDRPAPKS
jgi:hypothetical protein